MYVSFQVLSIINDSWIIHRIPVSLSGASTYNKLSRIMMLCCCTYNSVFQCNHSYMIPEYDAFIIILSVLLARADHPDNGTFIGEISCDCIYLDIISYPCE